MFLTGYHNGYQKQGISVQFKHILFAQMCKKDKAHGHLVTNMTRK